MRRPTVLLAALVAFMAVTAAPANAVRFKDLPADLQTLVYATLRLQFDGFSERQVVDTERHGHLVVTSTQQTACRISAGPPACLVRVSGTRATASERILGQHAYVTSPGLARVDGGHAWVSEPDSAANVARSLGTGVELLLASDLSEASVVTELGHATVDGQSVIEFVGTLPAQATVRLDLASNGAVVRQVTTTGTTVTTLDVSLNPPPTVSRPPTRDTIAWSTLTSAARRAIDGLSL